MSQKPEDRNYKRERELQKKRGEMDDHAARLRLRRAAEKKGVVSKGDGKELDHKKPLSKGGSNSLEKNVRVVDRSENRSFHRNPDGSVKKNTPKRGR